MKKIILILVAVFIVVIGIWFSVFKNNQPESSMPLKKYTIVAFGDSLVKGYGATEGNNFVSLVSKDIDTPIINLGKNGDTTASALLRINDVISLNPYIVILLLGGNDILRGVDVSTTEANLRSIITTFQKNNIQVMLLGIRGGIYTDPYAPMFKRLAADYNLTLVPDVLSGILGRSELMSDQIHPNDKGYNLIREKVTPVLRSVLKNNKK